MTTSPHIQLYTDGACEGNQFKTNFGGWAAIGLSSNRQLFQLSGGEPNTTNNQMELKAIIRGLQYIIQNDLHKENIIDIFSDSAYVVNCFDQKWYIKWQNNNWQNSKGEQVKNKPLWLALLSLVERCDNKFHKVKGHSGNKYNELVDQLAVGEIAKLKNK